MSMKNDLDLEVTPLQSRRDVVIFIHYYLPGYESGGPLRSLANLVELLGDEFNFHIITCNHDLLNRKPYENVPSDCWYQVGKARVWYVSGCAAGAWKLLLELRRLYYAPIYFHSLFDPYYSIVPFFLIKAGLIGKRKIAIAPRGELSPGALQLKNFKKNVFLAFVRFTRIYRNIYWHASTKIECADISRIFFGEAIPKHIHTASDLVLSTGKKSGTLSACDLVFLSRISRKKNLDFALRTLARCSESLTFHIYGTIEDELYWKECQALIEKLPDHIKVIFHGALLPDKVTQALSNHGLFFFPTRGENYGHVIAEALAAGIPVLLSDQTPWNDINKECAGWALPLDDQDSFCFAIDHFSKMGPQERAALSDSVRTYAQKHLCSHEDIEDNRRFLNVLLN